MISPPGLQGERLATAKPSRRRWSRLGWSALFVSVLPLLGCREDNARQVAAHQEAVAAIAREKQTLANVRAEQQRVYGEYLLNDFEGRVWVGDFSLSGALRLPWSNDNFDRNPPLYIYLRNKLPLGWLGQLDRLFSSKPEALPWYGRTAGDLYRRRIQDRFGRVLNVLRDRIALQEDRVQKSEEYARLIEPETAKK